MLKQINFTVKALKTENDKYRLETELEVLAGVKNVAVNFANGAVLVEFDSEKITQEKILEAAQKLGFKISPADGLAGFFQPKAGHPLGEKTQLTRTLKERVFKVQGMHCASCELIIEKRLLQEKGIEAVEASAGQGKVVLEFQGQCPVPAELNKIFKENGYVFSPAEDGSAGFFQPKAGHPLGEKTQLTADKTQLTKSSPSKSKDFLAVAGASLILIIGFILLHRSGLAAKVNVSASSALPMFFIFGILAGLSSCAALVGGLVLSMSKQWSEIHLDSNSTVKKLEPHLLFNLGRLVSYAALGAVLGAIGQALQISPSFTSILIFAVSIMMFFLALQMLGVKSFQRFQFAAPKFITKYVADETNFKGRYMPALMGAGTFFLPCGFTITAQSLALASGSVLQGGLIMFLFALGTLPMLLFIGLSSVKFSRKPHLANRFLKVAGVLVLFFALFNINTQLNVLGLTSLDDINLKTAQLASASEDGLPPIIDGKQILKMDASSSGYSPNKLKVRVGAPVRWEITDKGTSGCTNAIIARGLFDGQIPLTPGQVSVKEFTPEKVGRYKFSCWMGMISGVIEVVDSSGAVSASASPVIESGAKGCGCGGGGGSCGAR